MSHDMPSVASFQMTQEYCADICSCNNLEIKWCWNILYNVRYMTMHNFSICGDVVAQLVVHQTSGTVVLGSNPASPTMILGRCRINVLYCEISWVEGRISTWGPKKYRRKIFWYIYIFTNIISLLYRIYTIYICMRCRSFFESNNNFINSLYLLLNDTFLM